jgi:hypothetical protein
LWLLVVAVVEAETEDRAAAVRGDTERIQVLLFHRVQQLQLLWAAAVHQILVRQVVTEITLFLVQSPVLVVVAALVAVVVLGRLEALAVAVLVMLVALQAVQGQAAKAMLAVTVTTVVTTTALAAAVLVQLVQMLVQTRATAARVQPPIFLAHR